MPVWKYQKNICIFQIMQKKNLTFIAAGIILFFTAINIGAACKAGSQSIHFLLNPSLKQQLPSNFSYNFFCDLEKSLTEIGFCLTPFDSLISQDTTRRDELALYLTTQSETDSDLTINQRLIIGLLRVEDLVSRNLKPGIEHPLISINYQPDELETIQSALIKKISENIRTQYVCHLRIQSNPGGITILTTSGLEGKTPLEWIIPVGDLTIRSKVDGYEQFQKKVSIDNPGIHTYFLELKKKQFYNSKFLYPTIIFALTSAVCFVGEQYYYSKYQDYGENETKNDPDKFQKTFKKAQNYETALYSALACTAVSFTLTFVFR